MPLADARIQHAEAVKANKAGENPADAVLELRRERREAPTVAWLADYYIERHAKREKKSWPEDERLLNKDVLPKIGHLRAHGVPRRRIIEILEDIADRGAPVTANRTLSVLTKMFNFGVERDLIPATPCAGIRRMHKERARQRVLDADEIRTFWNALADAAMTENIRLALKLMLITGQRRVEVVEATWDEFDLADGWWTIAEHRTKNGKQHRVPLSDLTSKILVEVRSLASGSRYVFLTKRGDKPITVRAVTRAIARNRHSLGTPAFTPHDLRRSMTSQLAALGIEGLVVSKILNHTDIGVTAVYDRHSYDSEKRQALDAWARRLKAIVETSNVVEMVRA